MNTNKVSIITANYNKASYLGETINSVLSQSYQNWELIIVDDCSSDNSLQLVMEFCKQDSRIILHANKINMGGNSCRNKGLSIASGDYVIFLDSDDLMTDFCLSDRIGIVANSLNFDLWVFPMGVFKKEIGDCSKDMYWNIDGDDFLNDFLRHKLPWQTCQPLWSLKAIKALNGFDEQFVRLQDVELHTRALLNKMRVNVVRSLAHNCYYRIDEQRKVVNYLDFLNNFCIGAIQYYSKFYPLVNKKQKKILIGTLIETISNIYHQKRIKTINKIDAYKLTTKLVNACQDTKQKKILKLYISVESLFPFHPKGLKKLVLLLT
jgi:glycosyltransferase involved in cell wall biosynthesis